MSGALTMASSMATNVPASASVSPGECVAIGAGRISRFGCVVTDP
jgi:hypothetical protein